jgi:soluble lytic murein transglycosylase-like protein
VKPLVSALLLAAFLIFSVAQAQGSFPCERGARPDPRLIEWTHYYARGFGLDPLFVQAVVQVESAYCPTAVSSKGAVGLGQFMPGTAAALGINPWDPLQNLWATSKYLRQKYLEFNDWTLALAAYNAGSGRVREYGGVPPFEETQTYIRKVLRVYRTLREAQ